MDLEHTSLGSHCAVPSCNQRDFLPFTCDTCKRQLCLAHRTYSAHQCDGADAKDMTSIDCPICGKSVKYAKSQAVDDVWNVHFLNGDCTKKPAASKPAPKKCASPSCTILLGISNTFTCKKCNKELCLTHRASEYHECKSVAAEGRQAFLDRFSTSAAPATSNPPSSRTKAAAGGGKAKASVTAVDPGNSLKGTVERRKQQQRQQQQEMSTPVVQQTSSSFMCPFCPGESYSDPVALQAHVASAHPEPTYTYTQAAAAPPPSRPTPPPPTPPAPPLSSAGTGREVCPVCRQRFTDPIALVSHFESAHPSGNTAVVAAAGSGGDNSQGDPTNCSIT